MTAIYFFYLFLHRCWSRVIAFRSFCETVEEWDPAGLVWQETFRSTVASMVWWVYIHGPYLMKLIGRYWQLKKRDGPIGILLRESIPGDILREPPADILSYTIYTLIDRGGKYVASQLETAKYIASHMRKIASAMQMRPRSFWFKFNYENIP